MKKKCILMFLGIFPIACVRKKMFMSIFFGHFPVAGNKEKNEKKKRIKKVHKIYLGYCPNVL